LTSELGMSSPMVPLVVMQCFSEPESMLFLRRYHICLIWALGAPAGHAPALCTGRNGSNRPCGQAQCSGDWRNDYRTTYTTSGQHGMRNRAWFEVNGVQNQKITDSQHLSLQQVPQHAGAPALTGAFSVPVPVPATQHQCRVPSASKPVTRESGLQLTQYHFRASCSTTSSSRTTPRPTPRGRVENRLLSVSRRSSPDDLRVPGARSGRGLISIWS